MSSRIISAIESKTSPTIQNPVFDFGQNYVHFGPECSHVAEKNFLKSDLSFSRKTSLRKKVMGQGRSVYPLKTMCECLNVS